MWAPNEIISIDFVDILKRDVLVVKCHSSGFIWARLCNDKTVETTIRLIKKYMFTFDHPSVIIDADAMFNEDMFGYSQTRGRSSSTARR